MSDIDLPEGVTPEAITWQFVRAGGPGGQNVNKVATAVQLRVDLDRVGLPAPVRARLERLVPGQITQHGELIIAAQRFRSQHRNRQDALERLADLLEAARRVPKKRVKTRPSLAEKRRREAAKKHRGQVKKLRGKPAAD